MNEIEGERITEKNASGVSEKWNWDINEQLRFFNSFVLKILFWNEDILSVVSTYQARNQRGDWGTNPDLDGKISSVW